MLRIYTFFVVVLVVLSLQLAIAFLGGILTYILGRYPGVNLNKASGVSEISANDDSIHEVEFIIHFFTRLVHFIPSPILPAVWKAVTEANFSHVDPA